MKHTKRYIAFFLTVLMLFSSVHIGFAADENICMKSVLEDAESSESEQNKATVNEDKNESIIIDNKAEDLIIDDSEIVDTTDNHTIPDLENLDSINLEIVTQDVLLNELNETSENNDTSEIVEDEVIPTEETELNISDSELNQSEIDNKEILLEETETELENCKNNEEIYEKNDSEKENEENNFEENGNELNQEINEIVLLQNNNFDGEIFGIIYIPVGSSISFIKDAPLYNLGYYIQGGGARKTIIMEDNLSVSSDNTSVATITAQSQQSSYYTTYEATINVGNTPGTTIVSVMYNCKAQKYNNSLQYYTKYGFSGVQDNFIVHVYEPQTVDINVGETHDFLYPEEIEISSDAEIFERLKCSVEDVDSFEITENNIKDGKLSFSVLAKKNNALSSVNAEVGIAEKMVYDPVGSGIHKQNIYFYTIYQYKAYLRSNTIYTVIYTDGVKGETVFLDQGYEELKEGDKTPKYTEEYGYTETLEDGTVIPKREGYTFIGWTPAVADTVDSDMANKDGEIIYTATWEKIEDETPPPTHTYKVVYTDGVDGTVFADELYSTLDEGSPTPTFTKNLNRKGYKFVGWKLISVDSNKTGIQPTVEAEDANSDRTIIYEAQWEEIQYKIGWYDEDKLIQLDKNTFLEDEEEPSYSKELPTKEEDEKYTYIFKEWVLQETPLNEDDISYVASYTPIPKKYGYTIEHQYYTDGKLDGTETVSGSAELDEIIDSSDFEVIENYKDNIYQFSDVTPLELKITVPEEDNKIIFKYDRFSYKVVHQYLNENGDLDGQIEEVFCSVKDEEIQSDLIEHKTLYNDETYPYVSDSGNLFISDNVADNVITITYQKEKQLPKETSYTVKWFDTEEHLLKEETRTGFVAETKVPSESDYMIDGYTFLPKYKDNILSVTLKEDSSENVLILYFSKNSEKEEFGSYEIEHQYYVKDKNGNLKLEGTVKETISNIKVGTIIASSSIAKKYHYGNNVYEFLSAGDNIVIEKDSHPIMILKYVRTKQEDTNITITEENKPIPPEKDEPVEEIEPKEEVIVIQEENVTPDNLEQVKTGDDSNILVYGFLFTLSVLGICFLKKKR